ncbi:MAG TPA: glycosyltransferase, partial [Geminicoccaceae bacterium]
PGVAPEVLAGALPKRIGYLPDLVRVVRSLRPDGILAAAPPSNLMAVWARRLAGPPAARVVVSQRNQTSDAGRATGPGHGRYPPALLRRAYQQADAITAVSDGAADDLAAATGIPRRRIATVHNPVVGPDLAARAAEPLDHPWFAPGAPPVVLGVGRLHPQKDFPTLIRAFARIRALRPARLLVLGAPDPARDRAGYAAGLGELAAGLGVAGDVAFPGFAPNPLAYMARSAVFVLSSRHEGLPGVLIQAMACGCPVVSTDCPSGPAEILEGGRHGPLVPVGDDAEMARCILQALDGPPARAALRARAALFSVERAVDRYLGLLLAEGRHLDLDLAGAAEAPFGAG